MEKRNVVGVVNPDTNFPHKYIFVYCRYVGTSIKNEKVLRKIIINATFSFDIYIINRYKKGKNAVA